MNSFKRKQIIAEKEKLIIENFNKVCKQLGIVLEYNNISFNQPFYHGSNTRINNIEIQNNTKGEDNFLGEGIYITNNLQIAQSYGNFIYKVKFTEPIKLLHFFDNIPLDDLRDISSILSMSENDDLQYLGDTYLDYFDGSETTYGNESIWGKTLVSDLQRYNVNVNHELIELGYDGIVAPLNKANRFSSLDDNQLNICIINPKILKLELIS